MTARTRSRQGSPAARAARCAPVTVPTTWSVARAYSSSRHSSLSRKCAYTTVLETRPSRAMSAIVVAW
jgi:hypothetical protein